MKRLAAVLICIACTACGGEPDPRVADLHKAGEVRFGLFSTQYKANGEPKGSRPDIARALVQRISMTGTNGWHKGVGEFRASSTDNPKLIWVLREGPRDIIACLKEKACDVVILHQDERSKDIADFSHPILQYEFTMLVRGDSTLKTASEVDRAGTRIAAVDGHAAGRVAKERMKQADVEFVASEGAALMLLRDGGVDAVAQTRHSLLRMSPDVPGSRVLNGNYGMNINRFAIAAGHHERLSYINDFVELGKSMGIFQGIIDRDKDSAFEVAPPGDRP